MKTTHPSRCLLPLAAALLLLGTVTAQEQVQMWTPTNLPNKALWLDGSDTSNMTLSGTSVTNWMDKSGNGRNVTQPTAAKQPTLTTNALNGLSGLSFNSANNQSLYASSATINLSTPIYRFIVCKFLTKANQSVVFDSNTSANQFVFYNGESGSQWVNACDSSYVKKISYGTTDFTNHIHYSCVNSASSYYSIDGAGTPSGPGDPGPNGLQGVQIGNIRNEAAGGYAFNGYVYEVILTTALTTNDRQKVEGYLAWKWGMQTNLPSDHPYKLGPPSARGGVVTYTDSNGLNPRSSPPYLGGFVVHTFTSSDTFSNTTATSADVLVVAGGGAGGGANNGGGGGAGGYIYSNGYSVIGGSNYNVTVGAGGTGSTANATAASGSNSMFGAITATGGGGGGSSTGGPNGGGGGSGGGGSYANGTGGTRTAAPVQGNNGANGVNDGSIYPAGGGGGAGAAGSSSQGGIGVSNSISGTNIWYAGGGSGGRNSTVVLGGQGGGGNGAANSPLTAATSGQANTGGGGGGCQSNSTTGGSGGSGIVIVRYPYTVPPLSIVLTSPANNQSFSSTASVSATASFYSGTPPYTVKFYLDSALVSTTTNATSPLTVNLGVLSVGSHNVSATVTDSTSTTVSSGTAVPFSVVVDTTAPTPNPMTFAVAPATAGATSISMTATTATDALSPPVQYYFENANNTASNSGWISSPTWTNTGLTTGLTYGYRVKARDSATPTPNETAFSSTLTAVPADPTVTWDANGAGASQTDGSGTWLNANQWWNATLNANTTWNNSVPNNAVIGNGGAGGTITLGTVTAGTVALNNFTGLYTLSGGTLTTSGGIAAGANAPNVRIDSLVSGAGGLSKTGSGKLIIANTTNSYTGKTLVSGGGILQIGTAWHNTWTAGTLPSGSNLELNGGSVSAFYYGSRSLGSGAGQIQITGGVSGFSNLQSDAGGPIITFNANANYEVVWGASGEGTATGFFNPSVLVLNVAGSGGNCAARIDNKFDLNGATRVIQTDLTPGAGAGGMGTGGFLLGVIRNSRNTAGITKTGPGRLDLAGANTFNGPVTVSQGVLNVSSLANVASPNSLGQSPAAAANLLLAAGTTLSYAPNIIGGGGGAAASTDRSFTINGTAEGDSVTLDASGSGAVSWTSTSSPAYGVTNQARTLGLSGTNTGDNTLAANLADNGTGKVSVTKTGRGTWVLSGSSTFTGTTRVTEGTLKIATANALGNGALSVTGGAKVNLAYTGTKTVTALSLNGFAQTNQGTYGSSTSGATYQDDYFFTGNGAVTLGTSTACDILTFNANFPGSSAVITTTGPTTGTVVVSVPMATTPAQVAALAPGYTLSAAATCNKTNNAIPSPALSLTTPVNYIVTALSGATKTYAVTVIQQAVTCTATFNLGTTPASTNFPLYGEASLGTWIAKGALSNGSILRSVKATNVKLESPDNGSFAADIGVFVDPTPETPGGGDGLLSICWDDAFGYADYYMVWGAGDSAGPFTSTLTDAVAWDPAVIDLSAASVLLGNGYGNNTAYSGTITVKYDGAGNDILAFFAPANPAVNFSGATGTFTGGNTINLTLPYAIGKAAFKPSFFMSDGATCKVGATPVVSGVTLVDFTGGPVLFTVKASGGATKTYTVNVTVAAPSAACDILSFNPNFSGSSAVISTTGTVDVWVPLGTTSAQVAALAPGFTLATGATCNKTNNAVPSPALSLTTPVTYTVTAEDGTTTRTYTVSVIAPIFTENFDSYTSSGIGSGSGTQADTGLTYAYGGSVSGWAKSGEDSMYAVNLNGAGNWALMFWQDNVITLNNGIAANTSGSTYQVKFQIGTAVNSNASLATAAANGLRVEVLRADGTTLASNVFQPGAWSNPDNANLNAGLPYSIAYTGDGTGSVKLRISRGGFGFNRFEGEIDNISVSEIATSNYASWAAAHGIPGEPATGDYDQDGLTNLMEYALGLNPTTSSGSAGVLAGYVITYTKGAEAIANRDVSWVIQTSTTLAANSWTDVVTQAPGDLSATISYTLPVGVAGGKIFARLKVASP